MHSLEVTLKTLTPLWTGGVNTEMDRIHESGIIGSLRWWYEAIVRGLGGDVCDPILEQRCDEKQQCDVCQLFGATGWGRRFRLSVTMHARKSVSWKDPLNIRPHDRHRGWYLPPGWAGTMTVQLSGEREAIAKVATLLTFLEQWGGIGAKQSLGYGRFEIMDWKPEKLIANGLAPLRGNTDNSLPDIRSFTFYRVQFRPRQENWWTEIDGIRQVSRQSWSILSNLAEQGMVPISPVVKNCWRFGQSWASRSVEEWLFGKMDRSGKQQSRLSIGWAVRQGDGLWGISGWVWLPKDKDLYRAAETVHQMKALLSNDTVWLNALGLQGKTASFNSIVKIGTETWNELGNNDSIEGGPR